MSITEFRDILLSVDPLATHYEALSPVAPYTVWAEYSTKPLSADDESDETVLQIRVEYFTKAEYDATVSAFIAAFDQNGVAYSYTCEYYEETKTIHHQFDCEVV